MASPESGESPAAHCRTAHVLESRISLASFVILVALDVATGFVPALGGLGTFVWFVSYALFFAAAARAAFELARLLAGGRALFTGIVLALVLVQIGLNLNDPRNLSGESTQEIGCALRQLEERPDRGFHGTCLFGYPARQHFLAAVPTLIAGRSLAALHLGGSLYFLLGIFLFARGALRYLGEGAGADRVTALLLGSMAHFRYVNHFLFFFEQSIFPFSLGLIGAGLVLGHIAGDTRALPLAGLWLLYVVHSYTPSLALYFLALAVLVDLLRRSSPPQKRWIVAFAALSLASLVSSLTVRSDISILAPDVRPYSELARDLTEAARLLVFAPGGDPVVSPYLHPVVLLAVFSSLLFASGWRFALLGAWVVLIVVLAVVSKGYVYYGVHFRLHRASVTVPVLLSMMAGIAARLPIEKLKTVLAVAAAFFVVSGFVFQTRFLDRREDQGELEVIEWLSRRGDPSAGRLYYLDREGTYFGNLRTVAQYFAPELAYVDRPSEILSGRCVLREEVSGRLFTPTKGECFEELRRRSREPDGSALRFLDRLRTARGEVAFFEVGARDQGLRQRMKR